MSERNLVWLEALYNARGQQRGGWLAFLLASRGAEHPEAMAAVRSRSFHVPPSLAGYAAGPVARLLAGQPDPLLGGTVTEALEQTRSRVAPALGGIGDRVFHGALAPAVALWSAGAAWLAFRVVLRHERVAFGLAALAFLIWSAGCLVHLYWRRRSWRIGRQGLAAVLIELRERRLERFAGNATRCARIGLGLVLGLALGEFSGSPAEAATLALGLLLGAGAAWRGERPWTLAALAFALALCLAALTGLGFEGGFWH